MSEDLAPILRPANSPPAGRRIFLGVGNLHRADDGAGPFLAEKFLAENTLADSNVEVINHSGEGVSLMHIWEGADQVVVVDCMKCGLPLGTIRRFDAVAEKLSGGVFRYSSHLFGLAEAVEMSRQLGKLPKALVIYGIEGIVFGFGDPRSPEVDAAIPQVESAVLKDFAAP